MSNHIELALRLLFLAPSFAANASPLLVKNLVKKRHPVDFGKSFIDGRRIFGDNKSWEGLVAGVLVGTAVGVVLLPLYGCSPVELAVAGFIQGAGSMVGDLANSFLKRRLGLRPGAPLPVLDQASFMIASLVLIWLTGVDRLVGVELGALEAFVAICAAMVLHPLTNYIAYVLKLKEVPY